MTVEQILEEVLSVVAYQDPIFGDWVAVVRAGEGGCKVESRKNGTREGAVASAIMGLFAQRVHADNSMGITRELAVEAARKLNSLGKIWGETPFGILPVIVVHVEV